MEGMAARMPRVIVALAIAMMTLAVPSRCPAAGTPSLPPDGQDAGNRLGGPGSPRVIRLLQLMLSQGPRARYIGEQTTRLLEGEIAESRQIVKHAGPGRERIEFMAPPRIRGEVMLNLPGKRLHLRMRPRPRVVEMNVPLDVQIRPIRELLLAVRKKRIVVRHIGQEQIAGRIADIIEAKPLASVPYKRLWIDRETGVRLRYETVDTSGSVIATSYFTRIDYTPDLAMSEFSPASLTAKAPSAPAMRANAVASVADAQSKVGFRIREPLLPPPFRRTGVWLVGSGDAVSVAITYSDGVNTLRLTQRKVDPAIARLRQGAAREPIIRPGAAHWLSGDVLFTLSGSVRRPILEKAIRGLR